MKLYESNLVGRCHSDENWSVIYFKTLMLTERGSICGADLVAPHPCADHFYSGYKRKASTPKSPSHDTPTKTRPPIMALQQREPYATADRQNIAEHESDQEEEALVEDYKEQVHFDDGMSELDRTGSYGGQSGGGPQDMQAQLAAAATPLEYGAALDTKFASYDNYCNLFHYILNSEGPVDLEVPTVSSSSADLDPSTET